MTAAIVAPSSGRLASEGDCSECGATEGQVCCGMGIAAVVAPSASSVAAIVALSTGRFAVELQRLWRHLAAGRERQVCRRMGSAAIVVPSSDSFAAGLAWSNCGAI